MQAAFLDPSLGSENLGDHVIREAILDHIPELAELPRISTHHRPTLREMRSAREAELIVVGGSNIFSSSMYRHRQWLVTPDLAMLYRKKLVAVGVGWWQYQEDPRYYSRVLLRTLLNPFAAHSMRDTYSSQKLHGLGLHSVMTSCPTLWGVECKPPLIGFDRVAVTLTDYKQSPAEDRHWLAQLSGHFRRMVLIPMAHEDISYVRSLNLPCEVEVAPLRLTDTSTLNETLKECDAFVGTRLHAAIRALQLNVPAVVVGVDNRAGEVSRDTGLPVIARGSWNMARCVELLEEPISLKLPKQAISEFVRSLLRTLGM